MCRVTSALQNFVAVFCLHVALLFRDFCSCDLGCKDVGVCVCEVCAPTGFVSCLFLLVESSRGCFVACSGLFALCAPNLHGKNVFAFF